LRMTKPSLAACAANHSKPQFSKNNNRRQFGVFFFRVTAAITATTRRMTRTIIQFLLDDGAGSSMISVPFATSVASCTAGPLPRLKVYGWAVT
jgi:hypothetical protein